MAALASTDTTIKGAGLDFNVRSYKMERTLDFNIASLTGSTYYEIGDLPKGFVPRNVAIVELESPVVASGGTATTLGVYLKSDSAKLAERVLSTAKGLTVGQVTGKNLVGAGDTICVMVNNKPSNGLVKVVISGDWMTGYFDEALDEASDFNPADHVRSNMTDRTDV